MPTDSGREARDALNKKITELTAKVDNLGGGSQPEAVRLLAEAWRSLNGTAG